MTQVASLRLCMKLLWKERHPSYGRSFSEGKLRKWTMSVQGWSGLSSPHSRSNNTPIGMFLQVILRLPAERLFIVREPDISPAGFGDSVRLEMFLDLIDDGGEVGNTRNFALN